MTRIDTDGEREFFDHKIAEVRARGIMDNRTSFVVPGGGLIWLMRVLIIGCGYVGLPLGAQLVRDGHDLFGLRRTVGSSAELTAAGIKPLTGDITKPEGLAQLPAAYDWVVNCVSSS